MIDLEHIARYRENNRIEAKKAAGGFPHSLWETYSAFANTIGGLILLGVEESREKELRVTGIPDGPGYVKLFWQTVNDPSKVSANILTQEDVALHTIEGKEILVITVPRAGRHQRPVYIGDSPFTGAYRRDGEGDYHCSPDEVRAMLRDRDDTPADLAVLEGRTSDDLSPESLRQYRELLALRRPEHPWNYLPDEPFLSAAGLVDPAIKGIWCVPKYSNPQGITYSDETVHRFAKLNPAAEDFRIFWDNAYGIHHLYEDKQDYLIEILMECKKEGHPDMVYKFSSTSKISFPGSGIAAIAASDANLADIRKQMRIQTIGHDKLNQLRHARYFGNIHGMVQHMKKHADILRPKFDIVLKTLDKELGGLGIGSWLAPRGGYFISFDSMDGCAKAIVAKAKEAGLIMTGAGATFPYGKDPKDSNIRIAPSYPTVEELKVATKIFVLSVKLVSIDKLLQSK